MAFLYLACVNTHLGLGQFVNLFEQCILSLLEKMTMQKMSLMSLLVLGLSGCVSPQTDINSRNPSSDKMWNIQRLSLDSDSVRGSCDFTSSTYYIQRSNVKPTSVFVTSTAFVKANEHDDCKLNFTNMPISGEGMFFEGAYAPAVNSKAKIAITIGDIQHANNEKDNNALADHGYVDIHTANGGVYKIKPKKTFQFSAECTAPTLEGVYGFRKLKSQCRFNSGANGTVDLVFE